MIRELYSIRDQKVNVFMPPQPASNDDDAKRQIMSMLMKKQLPLVCDFPEDYALYHLGIYDDSTGLLQQGEDVARCVIQISVIAQQLKERLDKNV